VASIKKLAIPITDFGLRLRETSGSERLLWNSEFKTLEKKNFAGETFRVLKEKENTYFGKYGRQMVNIN